MKTISNVLSAGIIASWIAFFAIFSIQNITNVSLQFLGIRSINLPIGVLIAFMFGIGTVIGAILPAFFAKPKKSSKSTRNREYFSENDPLENWDEN
jgi:uncharacterized integral membrane protein